MPDARQFSTAQKRAISDAVARIAACGVVRSGSVSMALLDYLVEHLAAHPDASSPKSHDIAQRVLGLSADFDVTSVSDVRIEIGRLRQHLLEYYAGPGPDDPVRLSIPRGTMGLAVQFPAAPHAPLFSSRKSPWPRSIVLGGVLAVLATLLTLFGRIGREEGADFPAVVVAPVTEAVPDSRFDWLATGIENQLLAELSHYRSLRVLSETQGRNTRTALVDYWVSSTLTERDGKLTLMVTLLRMPEAEAVWSQSRDFDPTDPALAAGFFATTREIVGQIASPFGAIPSESRERLAAFERNWKNQPTSSFLCVLHWQSFDITKNPDEQAKARDCLSMLVNSGSRNATVWASYAFLTFLDWTADGARPKDTRLLAAEAAATRAVELDPFGSDGHESLGSILSALDRHDAAGIALTRAAELNPSNPEISVKLGWESCLAGRWDEGVATIRQVIGKQAVVPGWYRIPLALDAFHRGDYDQSIAEAEKIIASGDRRGHILLLAAAIRAGRPAVIQRAKAEVAKTQLPPVLLWSELRGVFDEAETNSAYLQVLRQIAPVSDGSLPETGAKTALP